jgi:elongation factor G
MAVKSACRNVGTVLLEPVMELEVVVPDKLTGEVVGDLNSRRAKLTGIENRVGLQVIRADVPLAAMFGYATDVRSKTQGRATYTMSFARYEPAPEAFRSKVLAKAR